MVNGEVGRYVTCSCSGQDDGVYIDEALSPFPMG